MNSKFYLFADFDGVMHPAGAVSWENGALSAVSPFRWWPELRDALRPLPYHVNLVVHSTWRLMWEKNEELFAVLPADMALRVVDTTPREVSGRQQSIEAYCKLHGITQFVVLDDEPQAFSEGWSPLVVCDPNKGVSDEEIQAEVWRRFKQMMG
jgi:hypothetical protein